MPTGPNPAETAEALWRTALEHQIAGEVEEAIKMYRRSLAVQETAEARTFLGWSLSFLGDLAAAISQCRRAIELDPELGNPYNDIGAYLVEMQREDEAVAWFERAKQASRYETPQFPFLNLARIHMARGELGEALIELQAAGLLAPADGRVAELTEWIGYLLREQEQGQLARAA